MRFNRCNKPLSTAMVQHWLSAHGVAAKVSDAELRTFQLALTHRSYGLSSCLTASAHNRACPEGCVPIGAGSLERLEFLGDAVLQLAITSYIFDRYDDQNESFLTRLRTKLVNGATCALFARHMGLGEWILLSGDVEANTGRDHDTTLEDAFEAWLGAIFKVYGFDAASKWMTSFLETHVDFPALITERRDHKDLLHKHFQAVHGCSPVFRHNPKVAPQGPPGAAKSVSVSVLDKRGGVLATSTGTTVKDAEHAAARKALKYLGLDGPYGGA